MRLKAGSNDKGHRLTKSLCCDAQRRRQGGLTPHGVPPVS
jgi:hypothetical protein